MKLTILGSGGALPTPRPFCQCPTCHKARKEGEPFKRNSSSLYINDIATLVDCGEDIGDSLNRRNIESVDNLFLTHRHPDHTFGLRPLLEAYYDFIERKVVKQVTIYLPRRVLAELKGLLPRSLSYYTDEMKVAKIRHLEHSESVTYGSIKLTALGYWGNESNIFAYLLEERNKKVLYASCDTLHFDLDLLIPEISNLDLLIQECGLFNEQDETELSFPAMIERIRLLRPKKTVLTHIEEDEIRLRGWNYLDEMKKRYADINFDFAYDGMSLEV